MKTDSSDQKFQFSLRSSLLYCFHRDRFLYIPDYWSGQDYCRFSCIAHSLALCS